MPIYFRAIPGVKLIRRIETCPDIDTLETIRTLLLDKFEKVVGLLLGVLITNYYKILLYIYLSAYTVSEPL
ncbi:MAG: hypothetical protein HWQ35_28095 [Nostoc sp. NMS1]|uniref:hypothetical protein n=1 Tax=unclassified Nostoc TaxID=2593658 RepID=UPI0025F710AF|nr:MULTISPECIES: hypothetical protein [unclassified Nostoc]MBN3910265.1 hypothetical protein [Nostoc sp. NMS1]MBN3993522.1 hypothetical protein [Nostoc sp. NMS2]